MTIDIQIGLHETHMAATLTGELTLDSAREAVARIVDAAWEHRKPHILIDWRALSGMNMVSTLDRFEGTRFFARLVADLRERGLVGVRVAHVVAEFRPDAEGFSETVAANRGIDTAIMTSLDEALGWLNA